MLKQSDIEKYSRMYKQIAKCEIKKKNYNQALDALFHSASLQHKFNIELQDAESEDMLVSINESLYKPVVYEHNDTILFYDSVAVSNLALSYQYLESLIATERQIIYLMCPKENHSGNDELIELAKSASNCELIEITRTKNYVDSIKKIRETVTRIGPGNIFLHMSNKDVWGCVAFSNIGGATVFYVDHGDEQFWLKPNSVDYVLEFRGMGVDTAISHRGFSEAECIVIPYYPILRGEDFKGFDFSFPEESFKVFSGGRFVKVYSEDDAYMKMIRKMLLDHPKVYFVFAGAGDSLPMEKFISENKLEDRWKIIPYRKDLIGVLKQMDLYLGTYPQSGGLMIQYAAAAGTAALEMDTNNGGVAEDLLPNLRNWKVTSNNWDEYFAMLDRLIKDDDYRKEAAQAISSALITKDQFILRLQAAIDSHCSDFQYKKRKNNIGIRTKRLIEAENKYLHRVPGIMATPLMLKKYPLTALKNLFLRYWYRSKYTEKFD